MQDQLPQRPNSVETGIINLDNKNGPETHWVAYAIDPPGIVHFDSYGLAPPVEFLKYASRNTSVSNAPVWHSTLPIQTLIDPPICGQEVLNVFDAISKNPKLPPYKVVHEDTIFKSTYNKLW